MKPGKLFKIKYNQDLGIKSVMFYLDNQVLYLDLDTVFLFVEHEGISGVTKTYHKITVLDPNGIKGKVILLEQEMQWISS